MWVSAQSLRENRRFVRGIARDDYLPPSADPIYYYRARSQDDVREFPEELVEESWGEEGYTISISPPWASLRCPFAPSARFFGTAPPHLLTGRPISSPWASSRCPPAPHAAWYVWLSTASLPAWMAAGAAAMAVLWPWLWLRLCKCQAYTPPRKLLQNNPRTRGCAIWGSRSTGVFATGRPVENWSILIRICVFVCFGGLAQNTYYILPT